MDLRQLAALVAVADHGTFSAAAKALFTVQSNVSSHIARLEQQLGTTLVDRSRGQLTEDGTRVVHRARRILRELDDIQADVASHDGDVAGDVRLGILGTTARWLLPGLLTTVRERHPRVRLVISEGSTSVLLTNLVAGQFNAAVMHLPVDDPELALDALFAEELVLVTPADHPLATREEVTLAELATYDLLLPPPGSALRRVLDRAAGSVGPPLHAAAEIDGVRLLATLALDGHGAAIVPATALTSPGAELPGVIRVSGLPPRVVALAVPRRPAPSAAVGAVAAALKETVRALGGEQPGVHLGSDAFPLSRG